MLVAMIHGVPCHVRKAARGCAQSGRDCLSRRV